MQGLNKVMLIGALGADPELRFTQGGAPVLNIRLATTERFVTRGGEKQERTEWHSVIMWGNRAEALNKYLSKGQTVYVEGRLQTRSWEDKDGNKRYKTEIVATELLFLGGGRGEERSAPAPDARDRAGSHSQYGRGREVPPPDDFGEDDIPF